MARTKSTQLTDGEQSIMEVLWKNQEASVRDITDELSRTKPTAYTTAQTLCKILVEKGYAEKHFKFSLLEQASSRDSEQYIIQRESYWKEVLMTRGEFGLNDN